MSDTYSSVAQARLSEIIESGSISASRTIERVMSEVPSDYVAPLSQLGALVRPSGSVDFTLPGVDESPRAHGNALRQYADRIGVPFSYLGEQLIPGEENAWRRELAETVMREHRAHVNGARVLVRSVGSEVRSVLSDRFRRLDSRPLLDAFIGAAQSFGAIPVEGRTTDLTTELRVIIPTVYSPVNGEFTVFGVNFINSDHGKRAYSINSFALRLVCLNGMVRPSSLREVHLGGRLAESVEFSDSTYRLDTEATLSATKDIVRASLSPEAIQREVDRVRALAEASGSPRQLGDVRRQLSKAEREKLDETLKSEDVMVLPQMGAKASPWKLANALSWMAHGTEDVERKTDLEMLAGKVLDRAPIAEAAE